MERIDLTKTIREATATFCQNRIGDKPPISVMVPAINIISLGLIASSRNWSSCSLRNASDQ
jgi:hypothetical protein